MLPYLFLGGGGALGSNLFDLKNVFWTSFTFEYILKNKNLKKKHEEEEEAKQFKGVNERKTLLSLNQRLFSEISKKKKRQGKRINGVLGT